VNFEERGIIYSASSNAIYDSDNSVDPYFENYGGVGNSSYSQIITLDPSTTYYINSYVVDCNGVYYGNEIVYTTP